LAESLVTPTLLSPTAADHATHNHPLSRRMAAISFLAYNLTIGCIFGTYGVMMGPIEAKLGLSRDVSSLGISLIMLAIALLSPVIGVLVGKMSIRLLMMLGALLLVAGFTTLAFAANVTVFLGVYALLLGPGMCLLGTMLPPTLVTRWYNVNRGRALGIVTMPLLSAGISPLVALVMTQYGLTLTYLMLAGLMLLLLPVLLFVVDYPPEAMDRSGENAAAGLATDSGMKIGDFIRTGGFWTLSLAYAAIMVGQTFLAAHIVPLAIGWGIDAPRAASLLTASAFGGMAGSVIFGWVADRIGGAVTLVILCVNSAILWAIVLLHPPFAVLALLAALMGLHGAGVGAVVSMALSQRFGQASFGRAFGLSNLVNLPFMVLGVPVAGHIYARTGSYTLAVAGLVGVFLLGGVFAAISRRKVMEPTLSTV
jgi:MFS family permease